MRIQGWDKAALPDGSATFDPAQKSSRSDSSCHPAHVSSGAGVHSDTDMRTELLLKIKKKIASGFYNSDSVIEDIGYGFAQALDHSL